MVTDALTRNETKWKESQDPLPGRETLERGEEANGSDSEIMMGTEKNQERTMPQHQAKGKFPEAKCEPQCQIPSNVK